MGETGADGGAQPQVFVVANDFNPRIVACRPQQLGERVVDAAIIDKEEMPVRRCWRGVHRPDALEEGRQASLLVETRHDHRNRRDGGHQCAPCPDSTAGMVLTRILKSRAKDQLSMYSMSD